MCLLLPFSFLSSDSIQDSSPFFVLWCCGGTQGLKHASPTFYIPNFFFGVLKYALLLFHIRVFNLYE